MAISFDYLRYSQFCAGKSERWICTIASDNAWPFCICVSYEKRLLWVVGDCGSYFCIQLNHTTLTQKWWSGIITFIIIYTVRIIIWCWVCSTGIARDVIGVNHSIEGQPNSTNSTKTHNAPFEILAEQSGRERVVYTTCRTTNLFLIMITNKSVSLTLQMYYRK